MHLFLREHVSLAIFHFLHTLLLLSIVYLYMLEQSLHPSFGIFAYLFTVSFVCLVVFLAVRFGRQRDAYRFLSSSLHHLDRSIPSFSGSPLLLHANDKTRPSHFITRHYWNVFFIYVSEQRAAAIL